jgi:hypothetical protein
MSSVSSVSGEPAAAVSVNRASPSATTLVGAVLLIVGLAAALSVDVTRATYKIKGDEATYVAMALSAAYDRDLAFERGDLERFYGIYQQGPEGIFLKRGKQLKVRLRAQPPFLRIYNNTTDPRTDRLYFGKAFIYSVAVAPFVWLLGMNGFLVFHVLLLAVACACGYAFLASQSRPASAVVFTSAFVGATVVPIYALFLTPEIFNFALVFVAYFFWLYKEVAEPRTAWLRGVRSDVVAAVLLGVATYSKPYGHAPLVLPLVLWLWHRRRWRAGFGVGAVAVAACAALFAVTALISGEFNYQGGDRKTFYSAQGNTPPPTAGFPFDAPGATWDVRGSSIGTDEAGVDNVLAPSEITRLLGNNVKYFLVGRHFGFVPYFFPGVVAFFAWIASAERRRPWRLLTFAGAFLSAAVLLIFLPYTWSGGGGPPGNRYYLSVYPTLFFLMPPIRSSVPGLLAWVGGALFTAKMLVNPFYTAKFTWESTQRGWARRLPVELTMADDLPVRLDTTIRARIPYGQDPRVLLYFLDQHAFPPEPDGMWISGSGRADILIRSAPPVDHFTVTAFSPIQTQFTVSAGAEAVSIEIAPNKPVTFDVPASGVRDKNRYAYLMSARSTEGFIPRLVDPTSRDERNLGVQMNFAAHVRESP